MNDFGLLIFVDMSTSKLSFYDITKNSIFNKQNLLQLDLQEFLPFGSAFIQPDLLQIIDSKIIITLQNGCVLQLQAYKDVFHQYFNSSDQENILKILKKAFLKLHKMNQVEAGYIKQIEKDILIDSQNQFWRIDLAEGLKQIQNDKNSNNYQFVHIDYFFDQQKNQNNFALIERNFEMQSYLVKVGHLLHQKENKTLIQSPEKYDPQHFKVIESRNMIIVSYYRSIPEALLNLCQEQNNYQIDLQKEYNNKVLFYDLTTGREVAYENSISVQQGLIPQHIEFLERNNILIICFNAIQDVTTLQSQDNEKTQQNQDKKEVEISSLIKVYRLEFENNKIDLKYLKSVDFDRGKIADIKVFEYFGGGYFLAAAIDNYIQIYKVNQEFKKNSDEIFISANKIETQINIYKMNVQKFEKKVDGKVFQYFELLVADIMKSFSVYIIQNDNPIEETPDQFKKVASCNILTIRKQVRNIQLKYQFPLGQWCTSMQSILIDGQHYYLISFFDQNLVFLKAPQVGDYHEIKSNNQQLEIVASTQIGEQVNTINKLYSSGKSFSEIDFLKEPSQIFISNQYIVENQNLSEKVSTSFFDKDVKFECQLAAASSLHSQQSLIFSTSEGNVYTCHFINDKKIQSILSALQKAMSEHMNFETLMSKYALSQLKSRYDDKIAFDQRLMQGYYEGEKNYSSQMKNQNLQEFLSLNSKQDQQNFIHNDMKYIDFLYQKKSQLDGHDSKEFLKNFIYADFISQLVEMNDKVQEKIVDRVNELIEFEKDNQKGNIGKGLEVREVIGLVAYATQSLVQ